MSITYSKNKGHFEISEENVIHSIVTNYSLMGEREYKAARLVLLTKISERKREGKTPCVLCVNVHYLNFLHTENV